VQKLSPERTYAIYAEADPARKKLDGSLSGGLGNGAGAAFLLPAIFVIVLCAGSGAAQAHGGGPGLDYAPCIRQVGADEFVHLTAYQPEFNPFAEYCDALPQSGGTLLVLDLMGVGLPGVPVGLTVVQQDGAFRLAVPPRRYRSGVINLRADLPPGKFTVLLSINGLHEIERLTFPLSVGAWWNPLIVPAAAVLVTLLVTIGYCVHQIALTAERRHEPIKPLVELPRRHP